MARLGTRAVRTAVLATVVFLSCLPESALAQDAEREAAVRLARQGELDAAIDRLRELRRRYPRDLPIAADLSVILHWAGRSAEALEVFETIGPDAAPNYALLEGTRAARAAGRLDLADAYLQRGAALKRMDEARRLAEELYEEDPESIEVLHAKAYFHASRWPSGRRPYASIPMSSDVRRTGATPSAGG